MQPRLAAALTAAALLLTGCAGDPEPDAEVGMTEYAVWTELSQPAGEAVWRVFNEGLTHHALSVCPGTVDRCEGENLVLDVLRKPDEARDPDSLPDATDALVLGAGWDAIISVELAPGAYRLWCGVPNHAVEGMQLEITVTG